MIDAHLDNPWMRVILSDINDIKQQSYTPTEHRLVGTISRFNNGQ